MLGQTLKHIHVNQHSATSILWTLFARNLDFPDLLKLSLYANVNVQRVQPLGAVVTVDQGMWLSLDLSSPKPTDLSACMNAIDGVNLTDIV